MFGRRVIFCLLLASKSWLSPELAAQTPSADRPTPPSDARDHEVIVIGPGQEVRLGAAAGLRIEAALDGGALAPVDGRIDAPASAGDHWLAVVARDRFGVASEVSWAVLRVDTAAPVTRVRFEPEPVQASGRQILPGAARMLCEASDDVAGVRSIDCGLVGAQRQTQNERLTVELPWTGGELELAASATDRVDNRSEPQRTTVTIDTEGPVLEIEPRGAFVSGSDDVPVLGPGAELELSAADELSGVGEVVAYSVDEQPKTERDWNRSFAPGRHRARVTARDRVGNEGHAELEFVLDANGPELSWQVSAERSASTQRGEYFAPPVAVAVDAVDVHAGVDTIEWRDAAGADWQPLIESIAVGGSSVELRATDRVGNRSEHTVEWKLDTTPPMAQLVSADGERFAPGDELSVEVGEPLRIVLSDEQAGPAVPAAVSYRRRGWFRDTPFDLRDEVALPVQGRFVVLVRAQDRVGNSQTSRFFVRVRARSR